MNAMKITQAQVRQFLLRYQELMPPYGLSGKSGIMAYIRKVGCIQFDPLNIVGRNPDLVLQSRVADFSPALLEALLYDDRTLLDGWDKMMSIYATEDWPYFARYREAMRRHYGHEDQPATAVLPTIRSELKQRGPLSSIDIALDETVDWHWAPTRLARAALESMYNWGELIVHHKVNTRKYYDFASNHIDHELLNAPDPLPTNHKYQEWHIYRRLGSIGLIWNRGSNAWLSIMGVKSEEREATLQQLCDQDKIAEIEVEAFPYPLYVRRDDIALLKDTCTWSPPPPQASIIAPLDNLMWDREYIETLFGFRYRWEVYTPVAKREYGYYVLPILYGDRFIARFEPGWDKKTATLQIKQWWWEPDVTVTETMVQAIQACFKRFLHFREAQGLQILPEALTQGETGWLEGL